MYKKIKTHIKGGLVGSIDSCVDIAGLVYYFFHYMIAILALFRHDRTIMDRAAVFIHLAPGPHSSSTTAAEQTRVVRGRQIVSVLTQAALVMDCKTYFEVNV